MACVSHSNMQESFFLQSRKICKYTLCQPEVPLNLLKVRVWLWSYPENGEYFQYPTYSSNFSTEYPLHMKHNSSKVSISCLHIFPRPHLLTQTHVMHLYEQSQVFIPLQSSCYLGNPPYGRVVRSLGCCSGKSIYHLLLRSWSTQPISKQPILQRQEFTIKASK